MPQLIQSPALSARTTDTPPEPQGSFEVNANDERPGAQLKNASGELVSVRLRSHIKVNGDSAPWSYGSDPSQQGGLSGDSFQPNNDQALMTNPSYKVLTLLGKLSTDSSSFAVGYYSTFNMQSDAELIVFANDTPGGYGNNSGTAVIEWSARYLQ